MCSGKNWLHQYWKQDFQFYEISEGDLVETCCLFTLFKLQEEIPEVNLCLPAPGGIFLLLWQRVYGFWMGTK